jgi:hypothetical protein
MILLKWDIIFKFSLSKQKIATTEMNANFSLWLVIAGTNNYRLGGQLRQLAAFYSEETQPLLIVRISQVFCIWVRV